MNFYNFMSGDDIQVFKIMLVIIFLMPIVMLYFFVSDLKFLFYRKNKHMHPVELRLFPQLQLRLSQSEVLVPNGLPTSYRAFAYFQDGRYIDVTRLVTWHSLNSCIASISACGTTVNSHRLGKAIIAGSYHHRDKKGNGKTISCMINLKVTDAVMTHIVVSGCQYHMWVNQRAFLTAHAIYSNGQMVNVTHLVEWHASDSDVLSVSVHGVAIAHKDGSAFLQAKWMGITSAAEPVWVKTKNGASGSTGCELEQDWMWAGHWR